MSAYALMKTHNSALPNLVRRPQLYVIHFKFINVLSLKWYFWNKVTSTIGLGLVYMVCSTTIMVRIVSFW